MAQYVVGSLRKEAYSIRHRNRGEARGHRGHVSLPPPPK